MAPPVRGEGCDGREEQEVTPPIMPDISDLDPADWIRLHEYARHLCVHFHNQHAPDRDGSPHWAHCLAVADRVWERTGDPAAKCLALLHDLLEDTECPGEVLMEFPTEIHVALMAITRSPDEPANAYFRRVTGDRLASQVKLDDIAHNFAPHRADKKILEKVRMYAGWYSILRRQLGVASCFCSTNPALHYVCECSHSGSGTRPRH